MNRRQCLRMLAAAGTNTVTRESNSLPTLLASGAASTLAGVRPAATKTTHALPPLRIGAIFPRSGYLAGSGDACYQGAVLAQTLLPRLGYAPLNLLAADTGEGLQSAKRAAEELLERGVDVLVGCFDSGQTIEVAALAESSRIPLIVNVGAAPAITQQGYRFVFRNFPDALRIVKDSYQLQKDLFAVTGFSPRKLVLLHINNGRGIELIDALYDSMNMPYKKVGAIAYDPRAEDLSAQVAAAKATGADALWTVSRMGDAIRITRELVRQQWTPGILMSSNADLHEAPYLRALGPYADYAVTFVPFYNPHKRLSQHLEALQRQLNPGTPLGTEQVYTFEALLIAADAYNRAQSKEPNALAHAIRTTALDGSVTGPRIAFDENGQNTALGLSALQNQHGAGQIVLPPSSSQARPILPMPPWGARPAPPEALAPSPSDINLPTRRAPREDRYYPGTVKSART